MKRDALATISCGETEYTETVLWFNVLFEIKVADLYLA